jgi:FemAB-related protein (PEP-CTERM system-associated)
VSFITCKSEGEAVTDEWNHFVSISPSATISHFYSWRKVISEAYGHRSFYLTARRDGLIAGILPLILVKSRLFGSTLSSMPFQDYGGIVANDEEAFRTLLDKAQLIKKELGAASMELRNRAILFPSESRLRTDKATLILDISMGSESLWKSFSPKVRNQIRKAQKCGLNTQSGGADLLNEFYRPFAINMRDLGSPVHHPAFFKRLFSSFGDKAQVRLIREGKKTIGGLVALFYKDSVVVPWASCLREYFPKCPNNLLYWEAIQHACNQGCNSFDFGRSSIDSGPYNFKLQWGAQPMPLHWQVFSQNASKPPAESSALRIASTIWKHIPVSLANSLGPRLRKHLTN